MGTKEKDLRAAIVAQCRAMAAAGLSPGSTGNISARLGDALIITPSAVPYEALRPELLATMPLNGEYGAWSGRLKPSTEWRFHLDIMRARADVGAIVHSHPPYCTALATLNRPILAAHYMIADFGGPMIECTRYAPFGTKELSDLAVAGLGQRHAVLLGNHGAIAVGADLDVAMQRALRTRERWRASIIWRSASAGRRSWPTRRSAASSSASRLTAAARRRRRRWPRPRSARAARRRTAATGKRGSKEEDDAQEDNAQESNSRGERDSSARALPSLAPARGRNGWRSATAR